MGYLDAKEGEHSRTPFRKAEKLYKRYKHSSTQLRTSKSSKKKVPPTDVSEVLDFRKYTEVLKDRSSKVDGVSLATCDTFDGPVFVIDGHPGFYFIPEGLSTEEQVYLMQESLTSFPQPPNRTNHNAMYGPISDLWSNVQEERVLVEMAAIDLDGSNHLHCHEPKSEELKNETSVNSLNLSEAEASDGFENMSVKDIAELSMEDSAVAQTPLNREVSEACSVNGGVRGVGKLWHFADVDEVKSSLMTTVSFKPVPAKTLLRKLRWATIGLQFDWSKKAYDAKLPNKDLPPELSELAARLAKPAMNGEKFLAEAAIVNYYGPDDMLGGHVDDMEADWSKPIVSISLGCKAVFLLGGTTREDAPVAMFLRSGDVVLMAGPARRCFHGVPRIFVESGDSDLPDFSALKLGSGGHFLEYISQSRINVNVRQVH